MVGEGVSVWLVRVCQCGWSWCVSVVGQCVSVCQYGWSACVRVVHQGVSVSVSLLACVSVVCQCGVLVCVSVAYMHGNNRLGCVLTFSLPFVLDCHNYY